MAKIDVYNLERQKVGEIELADAVFATDVKEQLLHEVVVAQLASRRSGTHAAKERAAVARILICEGGVLRKQKEVEKQPRNER